MTNDTPRNILLTGTSSGFGRLAAIELAQRGHRVLATMRDIDGKNAEAAASLQASSERIEVLELDVTDAASIEHAVARAIESVGHIDVLVNNAGVMNIGLTEAFTLEQLAAQMEVNYFGVARMFRAVLPHMRRRGEGLVITVSSLAGRLLFPGFHSYNSSKFAVEALAEGYRYELSPLGVDSVIVEPGPFRTELIANSPRPADEGVLAQYGELAGLPNQIIAGFDEFIRDNAEDATDPHVVVGDIARLIDIPFGQRPARTVSGIDYGTRDLNVATASYQRAVLEQMELAHLDPHHR